MAAAFLKQVLSALVLVALPSTALGCGNSFGGLDNHNALWEQVLGITFDNPVIKASSMNDRCWIADRIDADHLKTLSKDGIAPDASHVVYTVPGIHIEPDYATYADDQEAYENGRRTPMKVDVLRMILTAATDANRAAIGKQLAARTVGSKSKTKDENVENTEGTKSFGGIDVRLFTSRLRRGLLKSDSYTSAAMFTAPGDPRLLVILLGDTNVETDRVGGIRLEETLHQVLRDMERVAD